MKRKPINENYTFIYKKKKARGVSSSDIFSVCLIYRIYISQIRNINITLANNFFKFLTTVPWSPSAGAQADWPKIKVKKDCPLKQRTHKITKIGDSIWLCLIAWFRLTPYHPHYDIKAFEDHNENKDQPQHVYHCSRRRVPWAFTLRKHAYSNILKILPPKKWKFSDKNPDIFHISAQNIDCGTR